MKRLFTYFVVVLGAFSLRCNSNSSGNDTKDRVKSEQKALKKRSKSEKNLDKQHAKENVKFEKKRMKADEKSGSVIEIPKSERGLEEAKKDKKRMDKDMLF
ncbi:hypothetical protein [Sporocytophaga myxococcoides]|nr:hypothetical protein [Sporocytophaga myxococcoides]